jgi:hypothetical protein
MAIGSRYIDGDTLLSKIHFGTDSALARWLKRQPKTPKLVSRQGVGSILGISSPHVARVAHRLTPISIEGSTRPVYDLAEVKALKKELDAEKKAKS